MSHEIKSIAFYLPQFHPVPENDEWWGKGFTEWTNTAKAKPLFQSHYQPHVPADLGFYDLRCPETRIAQADMAQEYGITGFCYYHYWFGGHRILERPFNEVLASGEPDFPFCLCWANQTWTGIWHGAPNKILIEQAYPGEADYAAHFKTLIPAFRDLRYLTVNGKPIFVVYRPTEIPDSLHFTQFWRTLAVKAGLPGLYFIGVSHDDGWQPDHNGFDASILQKLPPSKINKVPWRHLLTKLRTILSGSKLAIYNYTGIINTFVRKEDTLYREFPCVIPNWDNTPRSGLNGLVIKNDHPELFRTVFRQAIEKAKKLPAGENLLFIKSWNEWAEGNHLEPDLKFGKAYLEVVKEELESE
ncbi:MAG: glycoside hydrolase family 99-like domain-containing protein [Candidatus Nitrotoga sp.]|nr:glycoside hydrolase family 99-like domain-containing protein [Candidatus Nitrotoga sp.]